MTTSIRTDLGERIMRSKDIKLALELPVFSKWSEGDAYRDAEQPARIGRALVDQVHKHLANARIGYLFRESMEDRQRIKFAKASKVGAKLQYFSSLDFIVDVNHAGWKDLEPDQRVALIDHELCHFGVEDTDDGTKFILIHHDIEEFGAIVRRWGMWMPDVERFARVLAEQGDLFATKQPATT